VPALANLGCRLGPLYRRFYISADYAKLAAPSQFSPASLSAKESAFGDHQRLLSTRDEGVAHDNHTN
jgi:hypothetical protein